MITEMEKENFVMLMEIFIKEIGRMVINMEKENFVMPMDQLMKEILSLIQ